MCWRITRWRGGRPAPSACQAPIRPTPRVAPCHWFPVPAPPPAACLPWRSGRWPVGACSRECAPTCATSPWTRTPRSRSAPRPVSIGRRAATSARSTSWMVGCPSPPTWGGRGAPRTCSSYSRAGRTSRRLATTGATPPLCRKRAGTWTAACAGGAARAAASSRYITTGSSISSTSRRPIRSSIRCESTRPSRRGRPCGGVKLPSRSRCSMPSRCARRPTSFTAPTIRRGGRCPSCPRSGARSRRRCTGTPPTAAAAMRASKPSSSPGRSGSPRTPFPARPR